MKRIAYRRTISFSKQDFWIIQQSRRRAKIKNTTVSDEILDSLRKVYMLERRPSGKKVVIDEYLYNIMVLQKDELIKFIADHENRREGVE